jgi:HlyD family secretion protein
VPLRPRAASVWAASARRGGLESHCARLVGRCKCNLTTTDMRRYSKLIVAALVAVAFIGTFVFLYQKSRPKPVVYTELKATVGDIRKTTIVTGKIEPRDEVSVKPQISGIISQIMKEPGDRVEAGEVIAKVKVIPDMSQLSSAQSRVRLAEINLKQATTDFGREKALYERRLVSDDEYDKVRQAMEQAREEKAAAEDALQVVRDGISRSNANASSTLIRSTISGIILDIPVKVGNSVILSNTFNDGTTIATVADMGDLIFRGNVDETEVGRLAVGKHMKITVGALENLSFDAVLEYISPKAVENNGANQFEIKAAVRLDGKGRMRSGYSANAEIVLDEARHVLTVPESAIEFKGDSTLVYVARGEGKERQYVSRSVTTGLSDGVKIEVKSGLKAGDIVRGPQQVASDDN